MYDPPPFQRRVLAWLMECFSMEVCRDGTERNHRFLEEALELVQSLGCTQSEARQLVDYVYGRSAGEPMQELGGVMVTLSALASCYDMNVDEAGDHELERVWKNIDKIRAKQAAKPKHSPLPVHPVAQSTQDEVLPCDVHLPVNTFIRKGVKLSTLLLAIRKREKFPDDATRFPEPLDINKLVSQITDENRHEEIEVGPPSPAPDGLREAIDYRAIVLHYEEALAKIIARDQMFDGTDGSYGVIAREAIRKTALNTTLGKSE